MKVNESEHEDISSNNMAAAAITLENSEELSILIDNAVDKFFNNHVLKFNAFGKDVAVPNTGNIKILHLSNYVR